MSLVIEQTDAAIRETFYNMEEGVEYVLNDFWFQETNRLRKVHGYSPVKNRQEYKFTRKGDIIFVNNSSVFDFDGKHNLAFAFALALQHNGLEKLKSDTCEGKVVEIDGKKYKLTAV
jgi:hypothetical protein